MGTFTARPSPAAPTVRAPCSSWCSSS
jgi:hypothetical protein